MAKTLPEQIVAIDEQITKLTTKRAELQAKIDANIDPASIVAGATVTFDYGKGETRRELVGLVLGVKTTGDENSTKSQTLIKVAVGTGFDATVLVIYPNNVKKLTPA
jgi:hypothetical protein